MICIGTVRDDGSKLDFDYPNDYRAYIRQLAGYEVEVEIRKRRSKRSHRQNAWLHAFLGHFAAHLGNSLEEMKLIGLVAVFGTHEVMGYTVPKKPHTSQLNTEEFSDLCEWFVQKAAECDFVVLYPEEFKRERRKQFSRRGGAERPAPGTSAGRQADRASVAARSSQSFESVSLSAAPEGGR